MKKCKNVRLLFFPHGCLIFQSYINLTFLRRIKLQARIVIICIISISLHKKATMIRWEVLGESKRERHYGNIKKLPSNESDGRNIFVYIFITL